MHAARGFTVIELITSIVIVGMLSVLALPRLFSNQPFNERGYIDEIAFTLRYAQKIALASQCDVSVVVNATGYTATQRAAAGNNCNPAGAWTTPVRRTDGAVLSGTAPAAVAVAPDATIVFDSSGGVIGGAPPVLSVSVYTLTVDAVSGWVTVQP